MEREGAGISGSKPPKRQGVDKAMCGKRKVCGVRRIASAAGAVMSRTNWEQPNRVWCGVQCGKGCVYAMGMKPGNKGANQRVQTK